MDSYGPYCCERLTQHRTVQFGDYSLSNLRDQWHQVSVAPVCLVVIRNVWR